jgi:NAD(P)-dependent dehydrogenase (short-subunit alcohol dehydrogenase family)
MAGESVSLAPPALGRAGDPEADLGPVAAWLVGPDSGFVTGVTVCADGGTWMAP